MPHQELIINGVKWPSATELTGLLPQPWIMAWYKASVRKHGWRGWQKCLAQTKRGGTIGSLVHSMIEAYIAKSSAVEEQKYNAQQFADVLFDKVNPLVDEYVAIEPKLISNAYEIHGTADLIVRMNGSTDLWVGDWKTSASRSNTHPIQLAIYALCWNEEHLDQQIDQGWIARVDKKSKKLTVHIDEYRGLKQYYPVISALRTIWGYSNPLKEGKD